MKRYLSALLFILFACSSVFVSNVSAQIRGNNITVTVTPDHKDWNYKAGEKIEFTVCVLKSGTLLDNADISYEMGPEMYPDVKKSMTLKTGTTKLSGKMQKPGVYRLKVTAHVAGKDYTAWSSAAVSPEKIQPMAQCPKDFDEFWANAIKEAR